MSAFGPKRTSLVAPHMSAFRGKADMTVCESPLSLSLLGVSGHALLRRTCPLLTHRRHRWHLYPPIEPLRSSVTHGSGFAAVGGRGRRRSRHRRLGFALRCRIGNLARALDRCQHTAVEVVEIAAYLQLARVVDKGSLIGPVDPARPRPETNTPL